jgi:hypothetical protein
VRYILPVRPLGKERRAGWVLDAIQDIRVGPSGTEINNRPVMELQILPVAGKKIGLLWNRPREEQDWVAYLLRNAVESSRQAG